MSVLESLDDVRAVHLTRALDQVFGKRIIVVGGGAQVAQVALGAVTEADRHNLRGERISVDTIPLVGEDNIAAAVRAVADLSRARLLVLAGSIMGGDISVAADELRSVGIPIIALNMVGSITEHVDLVVSDPVQAGTMAVMAIADTATFDLERQRGRRYWRCGSRPGTSTRSRPAWMRSRVAGEPAPDVLLIQETKLADEDAPVMPSTWPATNSSTTAKGAGTGWPSPPATGWPSLTSSPTSATARSATRDRAAPADTERG